MLPTETDKEPQTVKDGEFPHYVKDDDTSAKPEEKPEIPTDADAVSGLKAVTATVAGPNKLVATDNGGSMPVSTLGPAIMISMLSGVSNG